MKKILAVFLAFSLLFSFAMAESIDFSAMTDEQIRSIIGEAQNELFLRQAHEDGYLLIYDQNDIQLYLTHDCSIKYGEYRIGAVFVNNSDRELAVSFNKCIISGWQITNCVGTGSLSPHAKKKASLDIWDIKDVGINNASDLKEITIYLNLLDDSNSSSTPMGVFTLLYDGNTFSLATDL